MQTKTWLIAASIVALAGVSAVPSASAETNGHGFVECQLGPSDGCYEPEQEIFVDELMECVGTVTDANEGDTETECIG